MSELEEKCVQCYTPRSELTETPWWHPTGFMCRPCHEKNHEHEKQEALAKAALSGHDEHDCFCVDKIICPVCASEISSDDIYDSREMECDVCDAVFDMEIEWSPSYTTTLKVKG